MASADVRGGSQYSGYILAVLVYLMGSRHVDLKMLHGCQPVQRGAFAEKKEQEEKIVRSIMLGFMRLRNRPPGEKTARRRPFSGSTSTLAYAEWKRLLPCLTFGSTAGSPYRMPDFADPARQLLIPVTSPALVPICRPLGPGSLALRAIYKPACSRDEVSWTSRCCIRLSPIQSKADGPRSVLAWGTALSSISAQ